MMRLSGYQPQYFPRLHYFARVLDSDIFEISDYVQYVKKHAFPTAEGGWKRGKSYQADTVIKLAEGSYILSVPVKRQGLLPINETAIDYSVPWAQKHLRSIENAYSKAKNFQNLFPELQKLLSHEYDSLAELDIATMRWAFSHVLFENHPFRLSKIIRISETTILPTGGERDATDWIIEMCNYFDANEYYFGGTSAAAYMDFSRFKKEGIGLIEQDWKCQNYSQQYAKIAFIPNLSIIDLLMNTDKHESANILTT